MRHRSSENLTDLELEWHRGRESVEVMHLDLIISEYRCESGSKHLLARPQTPKSYRSPGIDLPSQKCRQCFYETPTEDEDALALLQI